MPITDEMLAAKLKELEESEKQVLANLNAISGAKQILLTLRAELARHVPNPQGS